MAPNKVKVFLSDSLRYLIFHSLQLEGKVPEIIVKNLKTLPGPPAYIVPHSDLPVGTVSELVWYKVKANGWTVVKAHQYRLPDGSIRGGPDPKYICIDDVVLVSYPKRPS